MEARNDHPINRLIASRWSPYSFNGQPVAARDLVSLFEAARWAPSSFNEQPWSYIVATKDGPDEYSRLLSCLSERNQVWAKYAPVLALGIAKLAFDYNGRPNTAALHDLGQASFALSIEATERGIEVHQMIGIMPERAVELYGIPDGHQPLTGLAIGYAGRAEGLPAELAERDAARRPRKQLNEFLFSGRWGESARLLE